MANLRIRARTALAAGFILLAYAGTARAECPDFPKVPWWHNLTHKNVQRYVAVNFGGNWNDYIDKWEKQYSLIKDVYERGSSIIVTKDKIKVKGQDLKIYLDRVGERLKVDRCLAAEYMAGKHTGAKDHASGD